MRTKGVRLVMVLAMAVATGACSTITQGSDQTVTVNSDPSGAKCKLSRSGAIVGVVNPTPGSVLVSKSKSDITVACSKAGYQDKASSLRSEFEGMTLGNLIFGGLIGVAIDASSGAINQYPPQVTVVLPPEQFPNRAARDSFYDARRREILNEASAAMAAVRESCDTEDAGPECARAIIMIKDRRAEKLAALEVERATAATRE